MEEREQGLEAIDRSFTSFLERKSAMSSVPIIPTVCAMLPCLLNTSLSQEDLDTQRFKFLSKLIQKGKMTVGENMYLIGQQLGFDQELLNHIVRYYHRQELIEFPVLGPYIKLVNDWYDVLDERDRTPAAEEKDLLNFSYKL